MVLQVAAWGCLAAAGAPGAAESRGPAAVREHKGKRGSPMITADLRDLGWRVSKNTVAVLMAEMGLAARPKKRRKGTTRPGAGRQDARARRT